MNKKVFIVADHGLAIIYFLQSEVVSSILKAGIEVVVFIDDLILDKVSAQIQMPGLKFEGLRLERAKEYWNNHYPGMQFWLDFLRRAGASKNINLEAVDSYIEQVRAEAIGTRKKLFPLMLGIVSVLRRCKLARKLLVKCQNFFNPKIYSDLFEAYTPSMVIASSPGWRLDKYILREAASRKVSTSTAIIGWDNSSSYSLPGAKLNHAICWSEIQKEELVLGSDWRAEQVHIGGIPSYDGYYNKTWQLDRETYFSKHNLDPSRKLISYAASFLSFSPNIQNIRALINLIANERLVEPSQLLIRLHPNHFMEVPRFKAEKQEIEKLVEQNPFVHLVEPVSLGGSMGHYSGEDMDEKSSMMAYSDIFTTVYSTMVVEASVFNKPVVCICIDAEIGWTENYYLPLSKIGGWPTHSRFRDSGAGLVAFNETELSDHINCFLAEPDKNLEKRKHFLAEEISITDGRSGQKVGETLVKLIHG